MINVFPVIPISNFQSAQAPSAGYSFRELQLLSAIVQQMTHTEPQISYLKVMLPPLIFDMWIGTTKSLNQFNF